MAPDIIVALRPKGKRMARPGDVLAAGAAARAPRFKDTAPAIPEPAGQPPRPTGTAQPGPTGTAEPASSPKAPASSARRRRPSPDIELERLGARLATANHELAQERERREALAKTLEEERTASRQLRTELGQARAELEVAATARAEAAAVEAELEDTRRELRAAQRHHEQAAEALARGHEEATQELTRRHEQATQAVTREHHQVTEAHAAVQQELHRTAGALESAREALAAERAETGRLRNRLAQAREARPRAAAPHAPPEGGTAEPRVSRRASPAPRREADPTATQRFDVLGLDEEPETRAPRRGGGPEVDESSGWTPLPAAERLRPVNPSLRHRTWWLGRLVALLVLLGVIAAVWLVLHSTVLH